MNAIKSITAVAIAIAIAATAAACGKANTEPPPGPTATITAEPTVEPTTPSPTEPAVPEVVIPTEAGAVVTADLVEQARAAGVPVYVSPTGDGSGIVVDPNGALPADLVAEIDAIDGVPTSAGHFSQMLGSLTSVLRAHDAAGTKVIAIVAMADVSASSAQVTGYTAVGSAATGTFAASGSKSAVLDAAQEFAAANPGTTVVDLTA